jgi:dTDP-4-dehydrorhamnose 3,5-epimerase-like enzyme
MSIADTHLTPSVNELRLSELPLHFGNHDGGELVVVEGKIHVPFSIKRIFTLRAPIGTVRGGHAHRRCAQFMICIQGMIDIDCDDGKEQKSFLLDRSNVGLLIPANIWAKQRFCHDNSLLLVMCDQPYEGHDYIRDYAEFLAWRNSANALSARI